MQILFSYLFSRPLSSRIDSSHIANFFVFNCICNVLHVASIKEAYKICVSNKIPQSTSSFTATLVATKYLNVEKYNLFTYLCIVKIVARKSLLLYSVINIHVSINGCSL